MSDEGQNGPDTTNPDSVTRRELLLRIARGAVYSTPVVKTLAAPDPAAAQAVSSPGGMMMTFCDYFPILCRIFMGFGNSQAEDAQGFTNTRMGQPAERGISRPAPWDRPSPGSGPRRPPEGGMR